jgi:hypothetical protein
MIFLANRANLDTRTLLTRLHNTLHTRVPNENSPIERVWYHTSSSNKVGVHARIDASTFLGTQYPIDAAELQVSFDFLSTHDYDFYKIQWVEPERQLMLGWHQDETHMNLGECHFQVDFEGTKVQRDSASYLDIHPLNVFDQRVNQLGAILDALMWTDGRPSVPEREIH